VVVAWLTEVRIGGWRGTGCRLRVPAAKLDAGLEVRALQGISGPAGPSIKFVVDLRMSYRVRGV